LLGRHEARRADDRAGLRQQRRGWLDEPADLTRVALLREPPVDHDGLPELSDQHVVGLEVAVDHAARVRVRERLGHRDHVRQQLEPRSQRGPALERVRQGLAGDEPHRVERRTVGPRARLVDRDDRGMLQARRDHRFALEPRAQRGREHLLDRHRAAEPAIEGADDLAHPARRDRLAEFEVLRIDGPQLRRRHGPLAHQDEARLATGEVCVERVGVDIRQAARITREHEHDVVAVHPGASVP